MYDLPYSPKKFTPRVFRLPFTFKGTFLLIGLSRISNPHTDLTADYEVWDPYYTAIKAVFSSCERDYNGTEDPNHRENQLDHDCSICHNVAAWEPADFNHGDTDFPLTGSHINVDCRDCHANGQFNDTPTDCYFCHEDDYNDADDPNHGNAGFPHDCASCHSTTNWADVNFNHDQQYFPIYRGNHRGEWNTCADCHTNPEDYSVFTCIDCHEHRRSEMDDKHDEVRNYQYSSAACFECHPDGQGDDAPPQEIERPLRQVK
jgi:hypothetical protein